ncbi:MAG: Recombination protein MgsA [Candidatus Yanofskybacteria bacterium GW2011_GWF1_44_227]|uniref:Recombination protein MgsA n=1 Tax=Candidatus Yanofskybacteria bacterium GW2011_GWE2_40_11 TaxID=1619033 RepID=A0A0G0T298_9BACT|nr:MAG: Recombination protein MgsA [Candidatus Yanofskybacteria bacterium GW2011_GWE1_40_10]KKR41215.1 MAG: Recombination protein MgsA [Candidatus Yanofskybacteria bacterium GW2011_GWE2_40_11]KKT15710.1 MAG: Recombination protein MgsA [Candidatus Yanofskybacteria bacterium GW2011_GWF2_43_596]KKT53402.1 MAG: Recombination protein MgsA [Candidatus Yanofskybacteria bacterium GW2011_GWF1_44_227]OGN36185.1 MAG: AAA family ATPase [Candidatus Yanofskybacteria bacterium RIFOXYA2_FULL_45_28]OGN36901.1 
MAEPLAVRIRPKNLNEYIGQSHLVGPDKPIRVAIEKGHKFSFILWGPPGSGKTTLAKIYAQAIDGQLFELSAVSAGKDDIREIVKIRGMRPKILFLDEIHRFNKAQQDYLLPFVENGDITLIGATTENPSFEIISPLLSRCQVFVMSEYTSDEMKAIIKRAKVKIDAKSADWLINMANGDARQAIGLLDSAQRLYGKISLKTLGDALQSKFLRYDKKGEEHHNLISAYIKGMRASQPDAALYYLARMIDCGEDPKFIARRMIIFASEDIGNSQPTAIVVANDAFRAVEVVGLPEAQINLASATVYLAKANKDRSSYNAFLAAMEDVKKHGNLPIPLKIRNAPTKLMKELNYGKGYEKYTRDDFLPAELKGKKYLK